MITISILGLDQYVVGHYSKENSANIANLLEVDEDDVNFYAPYSVIFHKGVEQTSWHAEVIVRLPKKYEILEDKLAKYLLNTLNVFSINVEVSFEYFLEGKHYEIHNDQYPRYIDSDKVMDVEGETGDEYSEEDEADPRDHAELDFNNPDELYLGDAFASHKEDLEKLDKKQETCSCCKDGHKHTHH